MCTVYGLVWSLLYLLQLITCLSRRATSSIVFIVHYADNLFMLRLVCGLEHVNANHSNHIVEVHSGKETGEILGLSYVVSLFHSWSVLQLDQSSNLWNLTTEFACLPAYSLIYPKQSDIFVSAIISAWYINTYIHIQIFFFSLDPCYRQDLSKIWSQVRWNITLHSWLVLRLWDRETGQCWEYHLWNSEVSNLKSFSMPIVGMISLNPTCDQ